MRLFCIDIGSIVGWYNPCMGRDDERVGMGAPIEDTIKEVEVWRTTSIGDE